MSCVVLKTNSTNATYVLWYLILSCRERNVELLSASLNMNYRNFRLPHFLIQVGTSSVVYPAAMFAPQVAARGVIVGEFNIEETDVTNSFGYDSNRYLPVSVYLLHT